MHRRLKYILVLFFFFIFFLSIKPVYAANECDPGGGKEPVNAGDSVCVYTDTQGEWTKVCQADGSFTEPTKCPARCDQGSGKCEVINSPTPAPTIPGETACNSPIGPIGRGKQQCRTGIVYQCPAGNGKTDADQINCVASGPNRTCTDTTEDQPLKSAGESCVEGTTNFNPSPTPGGAEEVPEVPNYGQFIPQPGAGGNCGIPIEDKIPPADEVDEADTRHACCYSWMADRIRIPDSANFADGVPGVDKLMGAIIAALNGVIDNFPFFINPFGALDKIPVPTVGKIKSWLLSTPACVAGFPSGDVNKPGCVCTRNLGGTYDADKICNTISDAGEKAQCQQCVGFNPGDNTYKFDGVWTTLGCINVSQNGFIQSLISLGVQIGGGTALLCIMYAAFLLQTSQGSPERIKKARDLMTSCITGLLLILFAVFILRVIGYDILRIPGLG